MALDPAEPLPTISEDAPCGPNLEFDADFSEFERLSVGKPEQQYGNTVVPAEEPEWKDVVAAGWALMERTYDLRVFAQLAVARLMREGMVAYAATLALTRQALETRWADVHPQLDPEDDNDPTLRANALLVVAAPGRVLRHLRTMPLARSPRVGPVTWRDIAISTGNVEVEPDYEKMSDAVIAGIFRDTDAGGFTALREAVGSAAESLEAIPEAFNGNAGYGTGPDFTDLLKLLRDIGQMLGRYAASAEAAASTPGEDAEPSEAGVAGGEAPARRGGGGVNVGSLGPVTSRADAVRLMELVIEYYVRHEPSSPLPLLIARATRLADKGFLDLVRDLAPDGLMQAERIAGEV